MQAQTHTDTEVPGTTIVRVGWADRVHTASVRDLQLALATPPFYKQASNKRRGYDHVEADPWISNYSSRSFARIHHPSSTLHSQTMSLKPVFTKDAPAPRPFYSQAIVANNFVFCSGQLPKDPKTDKLLEADVETCTVSSPFYQTCRLQYDTKCSPTSDRDPTAVGLFRRRLNHRGSLTDTNHPSI